MAEKIGKACVMESKCKTEFSSQDGGLSCLRSLPAHEVAGCTAARVGVQASDGLIADATFPPIDGYSIKCPILEVLLTATTHFELHHNLDFNV